ncbi:hypothetical protein T484DRAFT_1866077, partial [Baffinella frigidus]
MLKNSPEESFRFGWDKRKWDAEKCKWVIVKVYGSYTSPITILENMGNNGAAIWGYEFITFDKCCKIHFDYDGFGVKDGAHSTIRRMLKDIRAFFESSFGMHGLYIWTWCSSRETAKGHKNSYHATIDHIHVANNEVLKQLCNMIWPNGFLVPGEPASKVDTDIYTRYRCYRLPGCSKCALLENGEIGEDVPMHLITIDPQDPDDNLSLKPLPDPGFKATLRSRVTVIDADSTLLPFEFEAKKRKRTGEEQTSAGRAPRPQKVAQPHNSDATILHGKVGEVASWLVRTHPRIGGSYNEWFCAICAIYNEAGPHSEAALLAVEFSRIRPGFQGASDVEERFYGLQGRGSGGTKRLMGSLVKSAKEDRALVFATIENSSGLGHVEDPGANQVWVTKWDQTLRWADTEGTSGKWLVQGGAYLVPHAKLQMRAWIKRYYPEVSDEEFETVWCIETRSEYYEEAFQTYIIQELDKLGAPRSKRARMACDSGKEGAGSKQQAVRQGPKAVAPPSGNDDERGAEAGYKGADASSTSKHCTAKHDSLCSMEEDAASSSHAVEPGVQVSEPASDASLTEEAPAPGTCLSSSPEAVAGAAAAHRPSPAATAITTAPVTKIECGVESVRTDGVVVIEEDMDCENMDCESAVQECEPMVQESEQTMQDSEKMAQDSEPLATESTPDSSERGGQKGDEVSARPSPAATAITTAPVIECGVEHVVQDFEQMSQHSATGVEDGEHGDEDFEQMSQDGEHEVEGAAQESDPTVQVYDFENLSADNSAKVTKRIDVKHLNADMIDPSKDCFVKSGYKTGKSTMVHDYVKQKKLAVVFIVNLLSLKDGVLEKYADCDVLSYDDPKFREKFTPGCSFVTTLDSLAKVEKLSGFQAKDYVVFLDELHSLMTYLSSSTTLADKRSSVMDLFGKILRNCKQIIGVDNDICDVAFDFITKTIQRNHPYEFVINSYKSYGGVHAMEVPTMEGMEMKMYRRMCNGVGFTVCFNTRRGAERVVQSLKERCETDGVDPAKMKLFTSKEGARITDINEQWGNCWVFYSPVIVTGRDFNPDTETDTFCYVDGTQSLSPEECVQQLARNRNMRHLYWHLENTHLMKVAVFCEIMRWCVPDCSSVLQLQ